MSKVRQRENNFVCSFGQRSSEMKEYDALKDPYL